MQHLYAFNRDFKWGRVDVIENFNPAKRIPSPLFIVKHSTCTRSILVLPFCIWKYIITVIVACFGYKGFQTIITTDCLAASEQVSIFSVHRFSLLFFQIANVSLGSKVIKTWIPSRYSDNIIMILALFCLWYKFSLGMKNASP